MGASGSGKSTLALELIALGATLVSDDQTMLSVDQEMILAEAPEPIAGLIEARHVGLLRLPFTRRARVSLAIDLDRIESERLPPARNTSLLGQSVTLLLNPPGGHSAPAILQCLKNRRTAP